MGTVKLPCGDSNENLMILRYKEKALMQCAQCLKQWDWKPPSKGEWILREVKPKRPVKTTIETSSEAASTS